MALCEPAPAILRLATLVLAVLLPAALLQPVLPQNARAGKVHDMHAFDFSALSDLQNRGVPFVLCTVVRAKGSTPQKAGAKMAVVDDGSSHGQVLGTVGGGAIEHAIRERALHALATGTGGLVELALGRDLGMSCGGQMHVLLDVVVPAAQLVICGAGHVGLALAQHAALLGMRTVVLEDRAPERAALHTALPRMRCVPIATAADTLDTLAVGPDTAVLVTTHSHALDHACAAAALGRGSGHVAVLASTRKAMKLRTALQDAGHETDALRSPAGLDIGAETPGELALSLLADVIAWQRRETRALRRTRGRPLADHVGAG